MVENLTSKAKGGVGPREETRFDECELEHQLLETHTDECTMEKPAVDKLDQKSSSSSFQPSTCTDTDCAFHVCFGILCILLRQHLALQKNASFFIDC
jgi:hypothetical protein